MNEKRLLAGILATATAALWLNEAPATEFQISKNAPPHIQAMLQKAKERVAAERIQTPQHVESRILKVPNYEKKLYTFSPDYEKPATPEPSPEEAKDRLAKEAELAVLEAQLAVKKEQQAKAEAQMAKTEDALDSLKDTLNEGVPKPMMPELPELPMGMLISEPPKVEPPQPNPLLHLADESPALAKPEPITWDDSQEELVAFQDSPEGPPEAETVAKVSTAVETKKTPSYRFLFSQDRVTLEVEGLRFEIQVIGGSISIQEVP